ncbi:MAG: hypothetical protein HQM09_20490 [Candidatus Riflebacteria bacterium]|nr:hypothetical protein [Candidatus Riflebacteria bacterium]
MTDSAYVLIRKLFTLAFAFLVFIAAIVLSSIKFINLRLDILSYMGSMLMITLVYLELLIIRDHLWVLEGSIPEARRWREVFFSRQSMRQQKFRKMFVVIFAMMLFTWIYTRTAGTELYSFLGVILMLTVLYFEILSMRDEFIALSFSLKAQKIEDTVRQESHDTVKPAASAVDQQLSVDDDLLPKDGEV